MGQKNPLILAFCIWKDYFKGVPTPLSASDWSDTILKCGKLGHVLVVTLSTCIYYQCITSSFKLSVCFCIGKCWRLVTCIKIATGENSSRFHRLLRLLSNSWETVSCLYKHAPLFLADGLHQRLTLHQSWLSHIHTTKIYLKINL